jgi:phage/plasmid-like protein (TIGR03299 family)
MAYQGESPWHKLGQRMTVETASSIELAMAAAGINYTVGLESLYLNDKRVVPNVKAVTRTDSQDVLGTVSNWFKPIQNADAFGVFTDAMAEFGMTVEAAGALGKGERAWMLFKLPVDVEPAAGDIVRGYGVAINGHNGSSAFEFRPTPIRVVCQNTLNASIGAGGRKGRVFGISHIGNVDKLVNGAKQLVSDVIATMQETGDTFTAMAKRRMTPEEVVTYVETVFPASATGEISKQLAERRKTVAELVWTGVGAEMAGSDANGTTAWAAFNAVTEYFDHVQTAVATNGTKANSSALFGTGAEFKLAAMRQAERLVAV